MAAVTFSLGYLPDVRRFTLGLSNVVTEIDVPSGCKRLTIQFITNAGKIAYTGTDGQAIGSDYVSIPNDTLCECDVRNRGSVFVASATGSTVCEVVAERD